MGKGGAQLGKQIKGGNRNNKAPSAEKTAKTADQATEKLITEDIKMLEQYERLNKEAVAQKTRLKRMQQQEAYNTRINQKLIMNIHRKFMRAEKVDALRKEIEILAQNHEREVDRKDAIIQMLARDLDDAEEQFQTAQRTHMDKLHKFVELHRSKLNTIESEFQRDLKALKLEFNTERGHIETQHNRESKEMKGIISAVEAEENERIADAKQNHETEREEIRNKNLEVINELRINLENKIAELEKQFDEAHQVYVENTDTQNKNFRQLKALDSKLSKRIKRKKNKIQAYQNSLAYWKKKIETNNKECVARNQALRAQKEAVSKHCQELKARMKRFRNNETKKLTEMTELSRKASRKLSDRLSKAEKLLQLAELARKLETEREKVLPFYESKIPEDQLNSTIEEEPAHQSEAEALKAGFAATAKGVDGKPVERWGHLENFHKKYNKVMLDKLAIAQEKQRLQKENSDLRAILKQYLDGIAITADVVDQDNPLLIVNGRVNLVDKQQVQRLGRPAAVVEATQVVHAAAQHARR